MSESNVCRICLCYGVKMYSFDMFQLENYYEQIMSCKLNEDGLPRFACYECASLLHKFHKFKEKCHIGQYTLKEILMWKGSITYSHINTVKTQNKNLQSSLDIINKSNNKNVKCCLIRHISKNTLLRQDAIAKTNLQGNKSEPINLNTEEPKVYYNHQFDHVQLENNIHIEETETKPELILIDSDKESKYHKHTENNDTFTHDDSEDEKPLLDVNHTNIERKICHIKDNDNNKSNVVGEKRKSNKKTCETNKKKKFENVKEREQVLVKSGNWQKFLLSEEEAKQEFEAKGDSEKFITSTLKCMDCYKVFSTEDIKKRHKSLHAEARGPFECRFCRMRFKYDSFMTKHMITHYVRYQCLRCEGLPHRTEHLASAINHELYHNGVIYNCGHCGQEFRHITTYYTHLRTHRSTNVCTLCGASFVSRAGLVQHNKRTHFEKTEVPEPQKPDAVSEHEKGEVTYCGKCDIRFMTQGAYDQHLLHSAMHVEGEGEAPKAVKKPWKNNKTAKKPTTCVNCGKHFSTQVECIKHHRAQHKGLSFYSPEDRHICEICGASVSANPVSLAAHLNIHTKAKTYTCATCGLKLSSRSSLKQHLVTHTGDKPHQCLACDKRFGQRGSMMLHYRTVHLKQPYPKRNRRNKMFDYLQETEENSN